jgi:uncharacterized protein (TIGR03437 family)
MTKATLAALFLIPMLAAAGNFTTFIGDANPFTISAIAADSAGNTYVAGTRSPATTSSKAFLAKIDPHGAILFTKIIGGSRFESGNAVAVDSSGNIYIAGETSSPDFPLTKPLQTSQYTFGTGFIMKLTGDGSTVLYSTYFGGGLGESSVNSIATDSHGNLYVTGYTKASDFPQTPGMPGPPPNLVYTQAIGGAIVAEIAAGGDRILYAGAIFGTAAASAGQSIAMAIAVDPAGNAYIAGITSALNLPVTPGAFAPHGTDAFLAKIDAGGSGLGYLTYVDPNPRTPGTPLTRVTGLAVDASGNAYFTGTTYDSNFPTTPGAFQPNPPPPPVVLFGSGVGLGAAFLVKLNPSGTALVWSTYFYSGLVSPNTGSIAVDGGGNAWVTGSSLFYALPNNRGWASGTAFVAQLNAAGSDVNYSALYPDGTVGQLIALDSSGLLHVAGSSGFISGIDPNAAPQMQILAPQNGFGGSLTGLISPAEVISLYGLGIGPAAPVTAAPVNGFYPKTLGGVQVTINGVAMPLLYVSQGQINAVVPMGVTANAAALIKVINGSSASPDYAVWIAPTVPQALSTVLNQDGTVNSSKNPAKSNTAVIVYATGWQADFAALSDGQVATMAQDACANQCTATAETGSGVTATVLYGGAAPGIVAGVSQFNVELGPVQAAGVPYFTLSGTASGSFTFSVWVAP